MSLVIPKKTINLKKETEYKITEKINIKYQWNGKIIRFENDGTYLINVIANKTSLVSNDKINAYINKNKIITSTQKHNLIIIHEIIRVKQNDKLRIKNENGKGLMLLNVDVCKISE
jgi:hypothetical protein